MTWSAQRHVLVSPPTAGNTWAPEAYYDEELGAYVVFWASKLYDASDPGHTGQHLQPDAVRDHARLRDVQRAEVWQDPARRASTRPSPRRTAPTTASPRTRAAGRPAAPTSSRRARPTCRGRPLAPTWNFVAGCIGRDAGTAAVEGPTVFKANPGDVNGDDSYLFVDEYGGRGYIPLRHRPTSPTPTGRSPPSYNLPPVPRHGTVIPVTADELTALRATIVKAPEPSRPNADGEVAALRLRAGSGSTADRRVRQRLRRHGRRRRHA